MIFDLAAKRAQLTPERKALYFAGQWYSYKTLNERATRLAARLAQAGVKKGDRVSILAQNHLAHIDLILATAKLGYSYTPFNYRLSPAENAQIAAYVRPRLLFFDEANAAAAAATGATSLALTDYESWLNTAAPVPPTPDLKAEDTQMILFTGGTTGIPKGAMQAYRQGFYNAVNTICSWGLRDDDCVIQATPCFHAAVNAFTLPLLHLGARVVLEQNFDPAEYLELVAQERCTILFMVPTMFKMLSDHPTFANADLSSVRWAISGGAPCPEPVRVAFARRGIRFKQGYGLTEAGVNCFAMELSDAEKRPTSVGKTVMHAEAVIRNTAGQAVKTGEVGELTLHGPHVFTGYFERPEDSAKALRDGWLWTGDLAEQDEEGFFYIVGRRKEMFISGGENIFPVEIENALYQHPDISECAVLGVPDARWGEVGLTAVVLRPGASLGAAELKSYLGRRLANYKIPKHIYFYDALPKSGAGKILKTELANDFLHSSTPGSLKGDKHGTP